MMRVLAACDWFSPGTGGGAERVAWEVYRRIAAGGHRVTVVATIPDDTRFAALPVSGLEIVPVRSRDLSRLVRAQISLALGVGHALDRAADALQPDVVHANSLQFQTTPAAAEISRRRSIPFVVTGHIGALDALGGLLGVAARCHERFVARRVLWSATRAIAVSAAVRTHLATLAPEVPVDVVPNGVDHDRFAGRAPRPDRSGPFRIVLVGRLVPNKGPRTAIDAVARLREQGLGVCLDVVGDGPLRQGLERAVHSRGLSGVVRFLGHRTDLPDILAAADVLVRPSLTEGMPLSLLEAMAAGVPVVASDIPGNRSLVRDGETGVLVPPGDADALARAVHGLVRDPARAAGLASRAAVAIAGQSWDACAAGTLAALERAAGQGPRRVH